MDGIGEILLLFLIISILLPILSVRMIYRGPNDRSNNKNTYILLFMFIILYYFSGKELINFFTSYKSS